MKRLILSALVLGAASQAAGCIIVSDDDPVGDARVSWNLVSADANGNTIAAGCPVGADSAIVYSLPEGAPAADAYIDKFNCADGAGTADLLPPGRYQTWVRLTSFDEVILHAESGSRLADVADGLVTPVAFDIYVDHAFYLVDWTLSPTAGGQVACRDVVGEDGVSIVATHTGGSFIDTIVDCESGEGGAIATTDPIPSSIGPGGSQYTVAIALLNAQQQSIGDAPTIAASPDRALNYGNEYQDLGTVDIVVR
jgi:hypothetical protein